MTAAGFAERSGQLLLVLLLVTPVTHMALKAPLAVVVLAAVAIGVCARGGLLRLHPEVLCWFLYYVALGAFFVLRGLVTDAPGTPYVAATYMGGPAVFALLVQGIDRLRVLRRTLAAVIFGAAFTGAYLMYWAASLVGLVPASLFFKIDQDQRFGIGEGWIQVQFFGVAGLVFVIPFLVSALVTYRERAWAPVPRLVLWGALAATLCGGILSARKALILVIATTPLVLGALLNFLPGQHRTSARFRFGRMMLALGALATLALFALTATGRFDWRGFFGYFLAGFDLRGGSTENARYVQFFALVREWADKPLFGHGWGHGARTLARSNRPWEYELQYVLLLFSTGLVGFCLYVAGVAWTYVSGVRVIRAGGELAAHMIGMLVGLTGILIANATNPYLVSPGNMWMVFLPVALINLWLLGNDALPRGSRAVTTRAPDPLTAGAPARALPSWQS